MNSLNMAWLVDSWKPSRDKYLRAWQDAGWKITLWTAGQVDPAAIGVAGVTVREISELMDACENRVFLNYELQHRSHAAASDLVRFAALYAYGGGYADLDVLPNRALATMRCSLPTFGKPQGVPDSIEKYPIFGRPPTAALSIDKVEIRFVCSPPRHELLARIIAQQGRNELAFMRAGGYAKLGVLNHAQRIVTRTGPAMIENVVWMYAREHKRPVSDFLLSAATIDRTPENDAEHMDARYPEILQAARGWQIGS